jgi:hypothetical protein
MKLLIKSLGSGFLGCLTLAFVVMAEDSNDSRLRDLLAKIAEQRSENVGRNERGEVVSLFLSKGFLAETNITLLAKLDSLTSVRLRGSAETPLTSKAVASLATIPNLTNVALQCFFNRLEPETFSQLWNIKHLKRLMFWGVDPTHEEFSAITNLQELTCFGVSCSRTFGKQDLPVLTKLPHLNYLMIVSTQVTRADTNILKGCLSLTNFKFSTTNLSAPGFTEPCVGGGQIIIRVPSVAETEQGAQIEITTNILKGASSR